MNHALRYWPGGQIGDDLRWYFEQRRSGATPDTLPDDDDRAHRARLRRFEAWLTFFLIGVAQVSVEAADTARRILELREQHRRAITEHLGRAAGNGHRVLERLYEQPIVSVTDVRQTLGTTFAGANQIVQRLVDLRTLAEMTGRARHRRFRYDAYVRLFEEGA